MEAKLSRMQTTWSWSLHSMSQDQLLHGLSRHLWPSGRTSHENGHSQRIFGEWVRKFIFAYKLLFVSWQLITITTCNCKIRFAH